MNQEQFEPNYTVINEEFAAEQKRQNGFSIASLVLGIFSIVCCCIALFGLIFAILAIIFAVLDKKTNGHMNGMAIGGLICGCVGGAICLFSIISLLVAPAEFWEEYIAMLEEMENEGQGGEAIFRFLPFLR